MDAGARLGTPRDRTDKVPLRLGSALGTRAMHVQEKRNSRFRVLAVCVGLLAVCAQASSFWSCSWNTQGSLPIVTPPVAPSLAINVAPTTIVLGQGAVLSWSSTSATSCTASGAWSGPQPPQGTTTVKPATSGTFAYILNCATFSGSIAQSATLTVNPMLSPAFTTPVPSAVLWMWIDAWLQVMLAED